MAAQVAPFTSVTLSPSWQSWAMWGADHQEAIGADLGRHMASLGAGVDGDMLADELVGTYGQRARLIMKFDVLGRVAERQEGKHLAPGAERRSAGDAA